MICFEWVTKKISDKWIKSNSYNWSISLNNQFLNPTKNQKIKEQKENIY